MAIYSQNREGGWIFKYSEQVVYNYDYTSLDQIWSVIDKLLFRPV